MSAEYVRVPSSRSVPLLFSPISRFSFLLLLLALSAGTIQAQEVLPRWDAVFTTYGVDGPIHDAVVDGNGDLYVAGSFARAGGMQVNGIARWDGLRWSALGEGLQFDQGGAIYSMAFDNDGLLYVGGEFSGVVQANGNEVEAENIAVWNGVQWEPVATGVNGVVRDLVVNEQNEVYIAGAFSMDGSEEFELNRIVSYNGTRFSTIGDGLGTFGGIVVHALGIDVDGNVYAAGEELSGGIFKWDGQGWSTFGAGHDGAILSMAFGEAGVIYAGGTFTTLTQPDNSTISANRVARWNGQAWEPLGDGFDDEVRTLALSGDGSLYAGGLFTASNDRTAPFDYVAMWNGAWQSLSTSSSENAEEGINAVVIGEEGSLYAAGSVEHFDGALLNGIGIRDAQTWKGLGGQGIDGIVTALHLTASGALYAGGDFSSAGSERVDHIAVRQNDEWAPLGMGASGKIYAIEEGPDGSIYVGGDFDRVFQSDSTELFAYNVAKWDGTVWSAMDVGFNGAVFALEVDPAGNVYAGGAFTQNSLEQAALSRIALWDGTSWSSPGGGVDNAVYALNSATGGEVLAGGAFTAAGGVENTAYLARWDGAAWSPVSPATQLDEEVYVLSRDMDGALIVGGAFTQVTAETSANHLARWNGTAWSVFGSDQGNGVVGCCVRALALDPSGALIVGGDFLGVQQPAGPDIEANRIASWGAETGWTAMDAGLDDTVLALSANAQDTYVGGEFFVAGDFVSAHIARWSASVTYVSVEDDQGDPVPGAPAAFEVYPNPFTGTAAVQITVPSSQYVQIDLFDITGRRLNTVFKGYAAAHQTLRIDLNSARLPAGLYLLRARGEDFSLARPVVHTK